VIDYEALGRRAVSWPSWQWIPGMKNGRDGSRYIGDGQWACSDPYRAHARGVEPDDWPDLSDAATMGCMLELTRQVRGEPAFHVRLVERAKAVNSLRWNAYVDGSIRRAPIARCDTEAEALVLAYELGPPTPHDPAGYDAPSWYPT